MSGLTDMAFFSVTIMTAFAAFPSSEDLFSDVRIRQAAPKFSRTARARSVAAIVTHATGRSWDVEIDLEHVSDGYSRKTLASALDAALAGLFGRIVPATSAQAMRAALETLGRDPWAKKVPQRIPLDDIRKHLAL